MRWGCRGFESRSWHLIYFPAFVLYLEGISELTSLTSILLYVRRAMSAHLGSIFFKQSHACANQGVFLGIFSCRSHEVDTIKSRLSFVFFNFFSSSIVQASKLCKLMVNILPSVRCLFSVCSHRFTLKN